MQKLKMTRGVTLTFEEGCNKYLENCRQRNLREGTINHYNFLFIKTRGIFNEKDQNDSSKDDCRTRFIAILGSKPTTSEL